MQNQPAHLRYLTIFTLCLTVSTAYAEDSTLLIDHTRGIDNTQNTVIDELKSLTQSLKNILPDDATDQDNETDDDGSADTDSSSTLPTVEDSTETGQIAVEKPVVVKPVAIETVITNPTIDDPMVVEPDIAEPDVTGPIVAEPIVANPIVSKPAIIEPAIIEPVVVEPVVAEPLVAEPTPATVIPAENNQEMNQNISTTWIPADSDLRILEIRVGTYTFDDVIDAYQYQDIILLPIGTLIDILDIGLDVGPDFANGFIIKQENTFSLDTRRAEVIINGTAHSYNRDLTKTLDGAIYVESNLLSQWLGMELDIDLFASRLWVRSKLKLPFLARIEREARIKSSLVRLNIDDQAYPRHYESYKDYTYPFLDQTIILGQSFADSGSNTSFNSISYATADFLQHESSWYLAINDQEGVDDFRVQFGRTDPQGDLLGFMNAKQYQFGHVAEPRVNLINQSGGLEAGVLVSNYPVGRQTEYDRHRFIGELLPGWEVELYRNNAIIGYQQTAIEGQYDFTDVPLLFGSNHFRLVFYGPKGEIKEENKHFQLSQALTKQGQHYYRASSTTDDIGSNRTTLQYDYGLTKNLSSTFNFVSIPLQETTKVTQHNYLAAGVTGYWDALLATINLVNDSEGGTASEIDLQTRIDSTIIGINDIYLSNFFSEEYQPNQADIKRTTKLDINTAIPPSLLPRIPVSFALRRDQYKDGGQLMEIINQLSVSTHGFAITNQLTHQRVTDQPTTLNGSLQLSTNIENLRLRNALNYTVNPETELANVALSIDPGQYKDYKMSFGINHSLQQDVTEYSAAANKISGKYNLSLGMRYNTNNEINFDLGFSFGLGYEPRRKRWEQHSRTLANQGSISARVFLDSNQDGIFNDNDEAIEDAGVRINGGYKQLRSDQDGILFLTGIQAYQPTNVVVAPETLIDPLWTMAIDGIQLSPRPGHAIQVDFPVFMSGEIDGTVYLENDNQETGVGRVTVELVDLNDKVISSAETAYDGFYILSKVPLGQYRVRVSPPQIKALNLRSTNVEVIDITSDEPFINGIDFNLTTSNR